MKRSPQWPSSSRHPWLEYHGWSDRFKVLERIGTGAMGQVWRAVEIATGKMVALKIATPDTRDDDQVLARMEAEAATLLRLRDAGAHPNVVPIYDSSVTEDHACLVMEFIPGLTLLKWCESQRLDVLGRAKMLAEVARGCGWFHLLGVIHRDLKPTNVLVSAVTHQPVIVDFSIARMESNLRLTLTNEALGTGPYMAPEQIDLSRGAATAATDVYALGATLYELLTHVHPHPGNFAQIVQRHAAEVRPARPSLLNPDVARDLECICLKALSHRPEDRYPDGNAMAADLDRFFIGEPVQARPISNLCHVLRVCRRRPALAAMVAACVALVGTVIVNFWFSHQARRSYEIGDKIAAAMQESSWTKESFAKVEELLLALASLEPERAAELRKAVAEDVLADATRALQPPATRAEDLGWVREAADELHRTEPSTARRLNAELDDRLRRWEVFAEVGPPFDRLAGLFPRADISTNDNLLYPSQREGERYSPIVTLTDQLPYPAWIRVKLQASKSFGPVVLMIRRDESRVSLVVSPPEQTSAIALSALGNLSQDANGLVLGLYRNGRLLKVARVAEGDYVGHPVSVSLRYGDSSVVGQFADLWSVEASDLFPPDPNSVAKCELTLPKDMGIADLSLRTRVNDHPGPLATGDSLAARGRWAEAEEFYRRHERDRVWGPEALYKKGLMLKEMVQDEKAGECWERVAQGPPSIWRHLGNCQLWQTAVLTKGVAAAKRWLDQLPEPRHLGTGLSLHISTVDQTRIDAAYARVDDGLNFLRMEGSQLDDAVKASGILGQSKLLVAARYALAFRLAEMDGRAQQLLSDALRLPSRTLLESDDELVLACLEDWCRMERSERLPQLGSLIDLWAEAMPDKPSFAAMRMLEESRVLARAGALERALRTIQGALFGSVAPAYMQTSMRVVEGQLLQMSGRSDGAIIAWKKGLQAANKVPRPNASNLFDQVFLRQASRTWTTDSVGKTLSRLLGGDDSGSTGVAVQAVFAKTWLRDPDFLAALNRLGADAEGVDLQKTYAFCLQPPQELLRRWFWLVCKDYVCLSAIGESVSPPQRERVCQATEEVLNYVSSVPNPPPLITEFLLAWADPSLNRPIQSEVAPMIPSATAARMKWLLALRMLRLGNDSAAKELLESIQSDSSFDDGWREDVATLLKGVSKS